MGSTYSGTFHTDGGGLGGSLSLPSDWDRCLARYCIVKSGELGTLSGDLGADGVSTFLEIFEALSGFDFPESTLWSSVFCEEK